MFRTFGPPGTGKTTSMLDRVDRALASGIPPSEIAFLAFTRKAASEARERAAQRFGLDPNTELVHFRTLHSLAYRTLGIRENMLMKAENFAELSRRLGLELTSTRFDDDVDGLAQGDHPVFALINLARQRRVSVREQYHASETPLSWALVDYVAKGYENYKAALSLMDYTDLLEMFVNCAHERLPRFKLVFLDEAQDLSLLQWEIAHAIDGVADRMYAAGDDDQSIYYFSGAAPDHFIDLPGGSETLAQSYRVPRAVHSLATRISARIGHRFPKTYRPRDAEGSVVRVGSLDQIDMSHGSWFVLAQANYMLGPASGLLQSLGYLYERNGHRSISQPLSMAINGWEQLRKGREIGLDMAQAVYSFMSGNGKRVARGKKTLPDDPEARFTFQRLRDQHGLLTTGDMIWHDAMDRIPDENRAYIIALLRRGEKFNADARIRLSTIHGSKGGEADNVVLFSDLSGAALHGNQDVLHRLFYVGATRAKENLYIIDPESFSRSYDFD
jgi:superfamily I DNA/RNA helicase